MHLHAPLQTAWYEAYEAKIARQLCVGLVVQREPYVHKLRYAKVPKFDQAAALFGATLGVFISYLSLSTFGSFGTDLGELTVLVWYILLWVCNFYLLYGCGVSRLITHKLGMRVFFQFLVECFSATLL